ncbi:MAG: hypothetical protein NXI22_05780 [bacterium]|nr:hypothetical protein [bacterium]
MNTTLTSLVLTLVACGLFSTSAANGQEIYQEALPDPVANTVTSGAFVDQYYVATRYAMSPGATYPLPMTGSFAYWGYGPTWSYYPYWNYSPSYQATPYYGALGYEVPHSGYYSAYYPWQNPYYFYAYPFGVYSPYSWYYPSGYYAWNYPYYPGSYFYYNYSPIYTYQFGMNDANANRPSEVLASLNSAPISTEQIAQNVNPESAGLLKTVSFQPQSKEITAIDRESAEFAYGEGCHRFWEGEYETALKFFSEATASDSSDARYWYYKGMTETLLGSDVAAVSLGAAVRLESGQRRSAEVSEALQRVQGSFRLKIENTLRQARIDAAAANN